MRAFSSVTLAMTLAALLCSCGFMTPAKQYAGKARPDTDIAVIESDVGSPLTEGADGATALLRRAARSL